MHIGFHPESLPRHHSAFAAVLSKRKYDNINMNTVLENNVETATPALSANSTTVATTNINAKSTEANSSVEVVAKRKPSVTLTEQETDEDSTSAPGRDC